jgi:hypothetical protein
MRAKMDPKLIVARKMYPKRTITIEINGKSAYIFAGIPLYDHSPEKKERRHNMIALP